MFHGEFQREFHREHRKPHGEFHREFQMLQMYLRRSARSDAGKELKPLSLLQEVHFEVLEVWSPQEKSCPEVEDLKESEYPRQVTLVCDHLERDHEFQIMFLQR